MPTTVTRLDDETTEKLVIAYELADPKYYRLLESEFFFYAVQRKTQECMNEFFHKFGSYPTALNIQQYTQNPDIKFFVMEAKEMQIGDDGIYKLMLDDLVDMATSRRIVDQIEKLAGSIKKNAKGRDMVRDTISALSGIPNPQLFGEVRRGFAHEHDYLKKVWENYKARHANPERFKDFIPYGIKGLDMVTTGGTRAGHITLVYGDTSSGKTRFKVNLAYNMAVLGYRVLYISIEDPFDNIARMLLSRASLLDYTGIELAKLSAEHEQKLRDTIIKIDKAQNLPYLAFWPGAGYVDDIDREVRAYEAKTGQLPQVIFVDYANEMYPRREYNNPSERFNNLFSEIRTYSAERKIAFITSLQQSRTGKQKKKEEDYGLEDIGQSHYVAPHCHVVVFIKQTAEDKLSNTLNIYVQKNRYGRKDVKIPVTSHWDISFVGDANRVIHHDYIKELLSEPWDVGNEANYVLAPVNDPTSSANDGSQMDFESDPAFVPET